MEGRGHSSSPVPCQDVLSEKVQRRGCGEVSMHPQPRLRSQSTETLSHEWLGSGFNQRKVTSRRQREENPGGLPGRNVQRILGCFRVGVGLQFWPIPKIFFFLVLTDPELCFPFFKCIYNTFSIQGTFGERENRGESFTEAVTKMVSISRRQIRNIAYNMIRLLRLPDLPSVRAKMDKLNKEKYSPVLVWKPPGENATIGGNYFDKSADLVAIGLQSRQQLAMFHEGGHRVVCIDGTHGTNRWGLWSNREWWGKMTYRLKRHTARFFAFITSNLVKLFTYMEPSLVNHSLTFACFKRCSKNILHWCTTFRLKWHTPLSPMYINFFFSH